MIVGIGQDLCEIDRIASMLEKWGNRFINKVFTKIEREYSMAKVKQAQHFAARFAVKEAALKALGVPAGLSWQEMETVGGGNLAPTLLLHGQAQIAAREQGVLRTFVTITHAGNYASAVVIMEGK